MDQSQDSLAAPRRPEGASRGTLTEKVTDVAWLAFGSAMLMTLYYLLRALVNLTLMGGFGGVSRDVAWMAPLSHLIFFAGFSLLVLPFVPFLSRENVRRVALAVFVTLILFGVLLPWTQLGRLAALVLSAGIAAEVVRRFGRDPARWMRTYRRSGLGILAACLAVAVGAAAWRGVSAWRTRASLVAAEKGAPNVLFIILDTVRASALSLYGYGRGTTPQLDAFAKGGATFETAISPAPWTLPSHASMFTGRYPPWLSIGYRQRLDDAEPTLAEQMRARGYETVGIAANMAYVSWESGLGRGFTEFHDYPVNFEQILRSSLYGSSTIADRLYRTRRLRDVQRELAAPRFDVPPKLLHYLMTGHEVTEKFLSWRRERDQARPYFAFLNYFDAHDPYTPPDSLRRKFSTKPRPRDLYDAEIYDMDRALGRLFRELEQSGDLQRTLVIVASDHGDQFGERGLVRHANSVYTALVHVPLVLRFDGRIPAGLRIPTPVSLRDLGRTVLELSAVAQRPTTFPGTSLARFWTDAPDSGSAPIAVLERVNEDDPSIPASDSSMIAAFDDEWHLVRMFPRRIEEMFRYRTDSAEETNLIGSDAAREALPRLRQLMKDALLADRRRHARGRGRPAPDSLP